MNQSSALTPSIASNPAATHVEAVLRTVAAAMSATPLDVLAGAIGKDDTTACRVRSEEAKVTMSDAVRLIHAAGLKVVPTSKVCVDRSRYEAMVTMASAAMADEQTVRRLTWDDA